jgi:hypothetical protein
LAVLAAAACSPGNDDRSTSSDGVADTSSAAEAGETATDGADETSGGGTTTTGFVPDMLEVAEAMCDPWAQDCPEGEKCVAYDSSGVTWDANKCVPVTGDGAAGDPCISAGAVEGTDDCDQDTFCWEVMDVEGQLVGVCTPFCGGTMEEPICDPGFSCVIANTGSINLCISLCDPLLQDCGAELACFWSNDNFNCAPATENIPTGEPCGYINDCAAGNFCADAAALPACAGSACCAVYCDTTNPEANCVPAGTECVAFFDEGQALPGYENVGVCVLPE